MNIKDFPSIHGLGQADADAKLREEESTIEPPDGLGVSRYDVVRVPSNCPVEDDFIHGVLTITLNDPAKDKTVIFWGVFDGHEGWEMSTKLRISLMDYLSEELKVAYQTSCIETAQEAITKAIETAFEKLDADVMVAAEAAVRASLPLSEALPHLSLAYAGSCAIFSLYDCEARLIYTACVGDSRAILGRQRPDRTWETVALSIDQTLRNPCELARVQEEHPNEPELIRDDAILGMSISRAFGNGRWKYDYETQKLMKDRYFARSPRAASLTPPYLTAKPIVSITNVLAGRDFMIVASDGLWDKMTSEQAVTLVGKWLEHRAEHKSHVQDRSAADSYLERMGSRLPLRSQVGGWRVHDESVVFLDDNAATHLARNALGGADEELLRGLLTFRAPYARCVRRHHCAGSFLRSSTGHKLRAKVLGRLLENCHQYRRQQAASVSTDPVDGFSIELVYADVVPRRGFAAAMTLHTDPN